MYYHSYSLPVFKVVWNANAFLLTTVIPIVILLVINYLALRSMLGLSPLNFLRHDLSKRKKKHVTKLPDFKFLTRFRIRTEPLQLHHDGDWYPDGKYPVYLLRQHASNPK